MRIAPIELDALLGTGWRRPGETALALADALRGLVVNGRVPARTRVPSERDLALRLGVSRGSVSRAYDRLRAEGYLASRRGAGSWLTLPDGAAPAAPPELEVQPGVVNLVTAALPAPDPMLAAAASRAAAALPRHVHSDGYLPAGLPDLRAALADRLTARGVPTQPDEVLVTAGAQHALHLLLTLLAGPGERVLVDAPAYPRTLAAIRTARARAVAVPLRDDGWDADAWTATLAAVAPALAITVPDFHNPTGLVMSVGCREALARACARAGTLLVADETCAELRLDGPALPAPLGAFDPGATVVTLGTMSKSVWGGVRVGWIRASRRLVAELVTVRANVDMTGAVLDQLLGLELLRDWDAVLADRRALLRERRAALLDALPQGWTARRPGGGLSAWVRLPGPVATSLAAAAAQEGIALTPGPAFSVDGTFESHLRLPFTQAPALIVGTLGRLGELSGRLGPRPLSEPRLPVAV